MMKKILTVIFMATCTLLGCDKIQGMADSESEIYKFPSSPTWRIEDSDWEVTDRSKRSREHRNYDYSFESTSTTVSIHARDLLQSDYLRLSMGVEFPVDSTSVSVSNSYGTLEFSQDTLMASGSRGYLSVNLLHNPWLLVDLNLKISIANKDVATETIVDIFIVLEFLEDKGIGWRKHLPNEIRWGSSPEVYQVTSGGTHGDYATWGGLLRTGFGRHHVNSKPLPVLGVPSLTPEISMHTDCKSKKSEVIIQHRGSYASVARFRFTNESGRTRNFTSRTRWTSGGLSTGHSISLENFTEALGSDSVIVFHSYSEYGTHLDTKYIRYVSSNILNSTHDTALRLCAVEVGD